MCKQPPQNPHQEHLSTDRWLSATQHQHPGLDTAVDLVHGEACTLSLQGQLKQVLENVTSAAKDSEANMH